MKKKDKIDQKKWLALIFFGTLFFSAIFNMLATNMVENISNIYLSIIILIAVVLLGCSFDMIGIAITAADEVPFHAMAATKKKGAKESLALIKNADRVANVCADVIGDICGVLSGCMSALIATSIAKSLGQSDITLVTLIVTAIITAFTVFLKGVFKEIAIKNNNKIIEIIGRIVYVFHKAK